MADTISFYDVKTRVKIEVPLDRIKKTQVPSANGSKRFAVKTVHEGRKLLRFVSREDYEKLAVPEE